MKYALSILVLMLPPIAGQASILEPGVVYDLDNHPDGRTASPYYGLRLDGLTTGNSSEVYTFDFEAATSGMTMVYDDEAGTLNISGNAFGGRDGGSDFMAGTTDTWQISFTYTDVYSCNDGGLCANSGVGSISSLLFGTYNLVSEMGRHSYAFQLSTDHRGFTGISGWGWMNHCPMSGDGDNGRYGNGVSCDRHLYSSDWLFTVRDVPAPGTLALLGLGLAMVGMRKKA
ncbi:MAG: PEP-CTERM sorting domain-containing protein [Pseudomonadota bacterium]